MLPFSKKKEKRKKGGGKNAPTLVFLVSND